mgnify:CR=1 FL=1
MRRLLLPLAGSAILAAFSVAALPFSRGIFRMPATPYDASESRFSTVPAWILLSRAEPLVPRGSAVLVRTNPADSTTDTYLHRYAVALLPGRRIVPAARWGVPSEPHDLESAQYEVVFGRAPEPEPGLLLLEMPEGTVWRRDR